MCVLILGGLIARHPSEHGCIVLLSEAVQLCNMTGERHTNGCAESFTRHRLQTAACYLACVQQEEKEEWKGEGEGGEMNEWREQEEEGRRRRGGEEDGE